MNKFLTFLLVAGIVVGLTSALNPKVRAKRQGYGDLGGGDDYQTQQQQQPTQPTRPQTPSQSQANYPAPTPQQQQPTYTAPAPQSTYPTGPRPTYEGGRGTGGQYQTGSGQYQSGGGGGGQYQGGSGSGQYPRGGGGGGGGSGGGQYQDYNDYGDGANSLPGVAGQDYPIYGPNPPQTSFACSSAPYVPGYYADTQYGCQVWHICEQGGKLSTFLCPNGTIFNQKYLVCDWWYNVNCGESTNFYNVNAQLYQVPPGGYGGDQYKGSGYGSVGGTVVSGNAGAPSGGNSYGGRFPVQGGGSGPYQQQQQQQQGGGSYSTGGGRVPAGPGTQTGGGAGGGSSGQYFPSAQPTPTSGPAAPAYPSAAQPSGY